MALFTVNPTANETPDSGQGGLAVTGATNTGHASTTASASASFQEKTCRWSGFTAVSGQILSVKLKFDWTEDGSITPVANNLFRVQYTLNGGAAWTNVFSHADVVALLSSSSEVVLANNQDLTQVQVRDLLNADATGGGSTTLTASISTIRIEVTTVDAQVIMIM